MNVVLAGGSGQVGSILRRALRGDGHEVVILTRSSKSDCGPEIHWDGKTEGAWVRVLEGADALVNLAGATVNCRYNTRNREQILSSRVDSTRVLGEAVAGCTRPPKLWLQASTATIYSHRFDAPNTESTGRLGGDEASAPSTWKFSIDVATAWEGALDDADTPNTRRVKMRSAITLSPDRGGIFDVLLTLVRFGLGGRAGNGEQFVSWVHHVDFTRAVTWLVHNEDIEGVVNIASPHPLPNERFMRELRDAWGARFGLPAPAWLLELGAGVIRTESELILKSRRVVPERLLAGGFSFEYPEWSAAARDLCLAWRTLRG